MAFVFNSDGSLLHYVKKCKFKEVLVQVQSILEFNFFCSSKSESGSNDLPSSMDWSLNTVYVAN
jgi:hypothetical protein